MKLPKKINSKRIFIGLVIVGFLLLAITIGQRYRFAVIENSIQYITRPLKKGLNLVTDSTGKVIGSFEDRQKLQERNELLEEEVAKLSYDNTILEQYKDENEALKDLLKLAQRHQMYPSKGANVIAKDPGNWYKIFIIDQGSKAGFYEDDAVLAGGGLVGHIIESGPLSSKVLSIIDDRSSVSATVLRTGEVGILKGDIELIGQGICKLEIDIQSEVIKGDQIVTSHLSGIYPPGITIGVVEEIIIAKNGLTQYAHVRPVVDFKQLKQVLVLQNKGS